MRNAELKNCMTVVDIAPPLLVARNFQSMDRLSVNSLAVRSMPMGICINSYSLVQK